MLRAIRLHFRVVLNPNTYLGFNTSVKSGSSRIFSFPAMSDWTTSTTGLDMVLVTLGTSVSINPSPPQSGGSKRHSSHYLLGHARYSALVTGTRRSSNNISGCGNHYAQHHCGNDNHHHQQQQQQSCSNHAANHHHTSSQPNRGRSTYRSEAPLDRYSDGHGIGQSRGDCCRACVTRIPCATLVVALMCLLGVRMFCGTVYRGASLTIIMLDQVFHVRLLWIEAVQNDLSDGGSINGRFGFGILFVGFLVTGVTRHRVCGAWRSRVGGWISFAMLMFSSVTYIGNPVVTR